MFIILNTIRACLDWSICKGILKEWQSFGLVTSHVVWNAGMLLPVPQEGLPLLHKIQESKPPLSIHFFAEVRGARNNVCGRESSLGKGQRLHRR